MGDLEDKLIPGDSKSFEITWEEAA